MHTIIIHMLDIFILWLRDALINIYFSVYLSSCTIICSISLYFIRISISCYIFLFKIMVWECAIVWVNKLITNIHFKYTCNTSLIYHYIIICVYYIFAWIISGKRQWIEKRQRFSIYKRKCSRFQHGNKKWSIFVVVSFLIFQFGIFPVMLFVVVIIVKDIIISHGNVYKKKIIQFSLIKKH